MIPTNYLTATETLALIAEGKVSAGQVIENHRKRIAGWDPVVRAWVTNNFDAAVKIAEETVGLPLHGVIIGVKDNINTKDMPTEMGSAMYKGSQPGVDAAVVGLLRAAGATIIGKTTTAEFAIGNIHAPTTNPYDPTRRPGGSSAGSAAAVSDYQCHMALGHQTCASLLRPGAYCGVFAFKPTWGTLSLDGVKVLMPSADAIGVLARSVSDLELFAKITGIIPNPSPPRPTVPFLLRDLKFAFVKTDQFEPCASDSLKSIWIQAQALLSTAGASVTELDLGEAYQGWMDPDHGRYMKLCKSECSTSLLRELTIGAKQVDPTLAPCIENDVSPEELCKIRDELAMLRIDFDKIAKGYDGIITPSAPCEAPYPGGNSWVYFASLWTGLHVPAIHIPGFAGEEGMPMGLTLLGPRHSDERLLQVAKAVAGVFIGADEGRLKSLAAPEGAVHLRP